LGEIHGHGDRKNKIRIATLQPSGRVANERLEKVWGSKLAAALVRLVRERKLLREKTALLQRQEMLPHEFEHRFHNGLQVIVSLLSLQSRATATAEAAAQLNIAAERVAAFGRVHRRLHLLDHQKTVEFKQYLQHLCNDLASLLLPQGAL
jgi:two-component sensor histidine kinase